MRVSTVRCDTWNLQAVRTQFIFDFPGVLAMGEKSRVDSMNFRFESERSVFQKWVPIFQHLGLKPRRFINAADAVYVCTAEGWFRLGLGKYRREELNWLRLILGYLEERSFKNWAVTWRKTIIWEENNSCYLIQPWVVSPDSFQTGDPAALERLAEILAELHRCGKDYRENRGIEVVRDRWSAIITNWKEELEMVQSLKEEHYHEKIRKEISALRKTAETLIKECIENWEAGITSLFEHHFQQGVLGHGELLAKYIVWRGHDYFLLNWEHLSFQPKIMDLAIFVNDLAFWEPEWIIYFINQYAKLQPLWPEEYQGLKALLQYPGPLLRMLHSEQHKELDHKLIKEVEKDLKRKGRCLDKVWRELGSEKSNWAWRKEFDLPRQRPSGKMSLTLSPVETWGGLNNESGDSLIHVNVEQKLPSDIWHRLVNTEQGRVVGGGEGVIMEAAANSGDEENDFLEIIEKPPHQSVDPVNMKEVSRGDDVIAEQPTGPEKESASNRQVVPDEPNCSEPTDPVASTILEASKDKPILDWSNFPKPLKRRNQQ